MRRWWTGSSTQLAGGGPACAELQVHDRAGECPGDAIDALHLRDDELAELVHVARFGAHDDVVRTGDVFGERDTFEGGDLTGDRSRLADFGLDQNVSLNHHQLPPGSLEPGDASGPRGRCHISGQPDEPTATQTVGALGEFGLVARLTAGLPSEADVVIGPGDDAAVVRCADGRTVVTTDMLVEGTHFRRDWSSGYDVGRRAAAASLADVAAMGARPTALVVGFGAPPDLPLAWADDVAAGLRDEAALCRASLVGGDVVRADAVTLAVTALGELAGRDPVTRAGARPGDVVAVAGRLGWAAAGLRALRDGEQTGALVDAARRPQPPYAIGPAVAQLGATAMIDVSDGLAADLAHIARASGVRIDLFLSAARALGGPGVTDDDLLTGGEDHALAFTVAGDTALPAGCVVIGRVSDGQGVYADQEPISGGHDHFA